MAPISRILKLLGVHNEKDMKGKRAYSLDLSAATDRLPVKLQAQILNLLGFPGDM